MATPPTANDEQDETQSTTPKLTRLQFPEGYVPGRYTPWMCSPEPIYGPDELGEYKNAVEDLIQNVSKCDAAARTWEVLQAWEMRLFRRNYHFLTAGLGVGECLAGRRAAVLPLGPASCRRRMR